MIITILSEPRSGSTNLINWFYHNKEFTILFLPSDPESKWYTSKNPKEYKYNTKYLLIKEDYYHYKNYEDLMKISDKIILLYRENEKEQIESWVNAKTTNNWDRQWKESNIIMNEEVLFFKKLKKLFKETYLNKNFFKVSYEELYYKTGFDKLLNYLNIDGLENKNFPIGQKYRLSNGNRTYII